MPLLVEDFEVYSVVHSQRVEDSSNLRALGDQSSQRRGDAESIVSCQTPSEWIFRGLLDTRRRTKRIKKIGGTDKTCRL